MNMFQLARLIERSKIPYYITVGKKCVLFKYDPEVIKNWERQLQSLIDTDLKENPFIFRGSGESEPTILETEALGGAEMVKKLKEVKEFEENEIVHLEVGDVLDDILTKKGVSKDGTPMYHFSEKLMFGGKDILDKKLKNVKVGERVVITRCEDAVSQKTGNTYHQYLVKHEVEEEEKPKTPDTPTIAGSDEPLPETMNLNCRALEENDEGQERCLNGHELPCVKDGNVCPDNDCIQGSNPPVSSSSEKTKTPMLIPNTE